MCMLYAVCLQIFIIMYAHINYTSRTTIINTVMIMIVILVLVLILMVVMNMLNITMTAIVTKDKSV